MESSRRLDATPSSVVFAYNKTKIKCVGQSEWNFSRPNQIYSNPLVFNLSNVQSKHSDAKSSLCSSAQANNCIQAHHNLALKTFSRCKYNGSQVSSQETTTN